MQLDVEMKGHKNRVYIPPFLKNSDSIKVPAHKNCHFDLLTEVFTHENSL